MGTLKKLILLILFISFMVFVAFFGRLPAFRRTPIGALHRLIWVHIPHGTLALDQAITGGRASSSLRRFGRYMMYDRHWTVVIFFVLILVVTEYLYIPVAWPNMSSFTKVTASIAIFLPYFFLYKAASSDPGYITPENHTYHMSLYPFDHTLFHPGHTCETCNFIKPPRSKHCSICKKCIARADHHCIFINSCVGYGNHHWFLLLLFTTGILSVYGGFLGISILASFMRERNPDFTLWPSKDATWSEYLAAWGMALQDNVNLGAATLLSTLISPLVCGLFIYTVWLVYCGTTTNESLKWSEWKEDMADGLAFRRAMLPNRRKDERVEPQWTRWPAETEQIVVTMLNGETPDKLLNIPGVGEWERVWNLRNVENLYDLGFWDNLRDIFFKDFGSGPCHDEPIVERRRRKR